MRVGRVDMAAEVLVEGWGGGSRKRRVEGEWDRLADVGELNL